MHKQEEFQGSLNTVPKGLSPPQEVLADPFSSFLSLVCLRNTFPNSFSDKHILTKLLCRHGKGPFLGLQSHTVNELRQECEAHVWSRLSVDRPPDQDSLTTISTQSCYIKNQKQRKCDEIIPVNCSLAQLEIHFQISIRFVGLTDVISTPCLLFVKMRLHLRCHRTISSTTLRADWSISSWTNERQRQARACC